jgi:hypothetical protein
MLENMKGQFYGSKWVGFVKYQIYRKGIKGIKCCIFRVTTSKHSCFV